MTELLDVCKLLYRYEFEWCPSGTLFSALMDKSDKALLTVDDIVGVAKIALLFKRTQLYNFSLKVLVKHPQFKDHIDTLDHDMMKGALKIFHKKKLRSVK